MPPVNSVTFMIMYKCIFGSIAVVLFSSCADNPSRNSTIDVELLTRTQLHKYGLNKKGIDTLLPYTQNETGKLTLALGSEIEIEKEFAPDQAIGRDVGDLVCVVITIEQCEAKTIAMAYENARQIARLAAKNKKTRFVDNKIFIELVDKVPEK